MDAEGQMTERATATEAGLLIAVNCNCGPAADTLQLHL
jgi:hypothetical protein